MSLRNTSGGPERDLSGNLRGNLRGTTRNLRGNLRGTMRSVSGNLSGTMRNLRGTSARTFGDRGFLHLFYLLSFYFSKPLYLILIICT